MKILKFLLNLGGIIYLSLFIAVMLSIKNKVTKVL